VKYVETIQFFPAFVVQYTNVEVVSREEGIAFPLFENSSVLRWGSMNNPLNQLLFMMAMNLTGLSRTVAGTVIFSHRPTRTSSRPIMDDSLVSTLQQSPSPKFFPSVMPTQNHRQYAITL